MLHFDTKLTSLDVSRNKITRKGAQAFLDALKKLIRIQEFQITYGNPIPLDLNLAIQQEVTANNQIDKNQKEAHLINHSSKMSLSSGRYELIDRGPLYMRCAIKSVELLNICHLSLPDNMLGFEEAKLLAAMIELDPPLRTLNLETNNLDAACAKLIANALTKNSNLLSLNLARNKLSDLGINYIIQTLINARF
jgi:Leucine-rich repeat (LRR) protein